MDRDCFLLTDAQFARIEPHLPTDTRGKPRVDDRRVIGGYRLLPGGTPREKAFRERWKGHRNKRRGDDPSNRAAGMKPGEVEAYWR
jgi:transposase